MEQKLYDTVTDCPVIAAIKDDAGLERCLDSDIQIVFVLYGDIVSIPEIVDRIKKKGKLADGIISTKLSFIKRAKELGMATVFRFFVIDSMAFDNIQKQYEAACPDFVEILPGIMPKIIAKVAKMVSAPVIAGGLIAEKADIYAAIEAGAISISSTNQNTWFI